MWKKMSNNEVLSHLLLQQRLGSLIEGGHLVDGDTCAVKTTFHHCLWVVSVTVLKVT